LRFKIDADGKITDEREEPIAADVRPQGDGKHIALQKMVAGLLGLGLDQIVRRAERAQRRKLRNWVGALSLLVVIFAGLAVWAEINRQDAVKQRLLAEQNFNVAKHAADALVFDIAQGLR